VQLQQFKDRFKPLIAGTMQSQLDGIAVAELRGSMAHLLGLGKLYRPLLALAACQAVSGKDPAEYIKLITPLEMIHTFTLIHDDLPCMDDAELRRGIKAVHIAYSEATAVLAGDALLSHALYLLATEPPQLPAGVRCRLTAQATRATSLVVEGQVLDLQGEGQELSAGELERLHTRKTGALLGACCYTGALLGGAGEDGAQRLWLLGQRLGLAFQVRDDLLSLESTDEQMGKTLATDVEKQKATYPRALGVEGAQHYLVELLDANEAEIDALGLPAPDALAALAREAGERDN
jgi:geranylgeranyl diphosphate synthase type II